MVIGATNKLVSAASAGFSEKELNQYESVLLVSSGFFCVGLLRSADRMLSFLGYTSTEQSSGHGNIGSELSDFLLQIPFNLSETRSLRIGVCGGNSMLVPDFLFESKHSQMLFESNFGTRESTPGLIGINDEMKMLFNLPQEVIDVLKRIAPSAEVLPIEYYLLRTPVSMTAGESMQCLLTPGNLHIVAKRDGKLLLVNRFDIREETDALYHTCNTALRLGFSFLDAHLFISGLVQLSGDFFKHTARYFGHVTADPGNAGVGISSDFSEVKMHYFAPLSYI